VKFCHECGYHLPVGTEKFCPDCGQNLGEKGAAGTRDITSVGINDTKGDVFGAGITGSGNIIGKEVEYTVNGNVYNLKVDNLSNEVLEGLQKITAFQVNDSGTSNELMVIKQDIKGILNEIKRIDTEKGTQIQEIKAGELQISREELRVKELFIEAKDHFNKSEYYDAVDLLDKALEIDPNEVDSLIFKGMVLVKCLRKYDEGIICFDRVLEIDPNNPIAWNGKGSALLDLGKYDEAIGYFDKAFGLSRNYPTKPFNTPPGSTSLSYKSDALLKLEKYEEAFRCYDKALELYPNERWTWAYKGDALLKLEKYEEAIKWYDKAIEIDPDYADAWYNKGLALYKLGRQEGPPSRAVKVQEAIKWYDKAIEIDPDYADAWYNKGLALADDDGPFLSHEAMICYEKAKQIRQKKKAINNPPQQVASPYGKNVESKKVKHYTWDGKPVYE